MEKLLKRGYFGNISQLNAIQAIQTPFMHHDLQSILSKHHTIFSIPHVLPPSSGVHDHSIPLVPESIPPNVFPYRHPFSQKNEIDKIVQELLGVICHNTSMYSSHVVMFFKKEGTWCMCLGFHSLKKLTIKDKFPIPIIDDLLNELSGVHYFTKLDLHSSYHQIHMKEADICNMAFRTHEV
jgi:hypothetical protein